VHFNDVHPVDAYNGWRGSKAWLNAWLMGWPDLAVFDGGWYEWYLKAFKNQRILGMPY